MSIIKNLFCLFKNQKATPALTQTTETKETTADAVPKCGAALSIQVDTRSINTDRIRKRFIAFDVETTGLNSLSERIVEIGAVIFSDGQISGTFSSLVNPGIPISPAASAVNNITNDMLVDAPSEEEIYPKLIDFLGDALQGQTILCAHNADFDLRFLCGTLSRLGYDAEFRYADTLEIAKEYLPRLEDHKQDSLIKYFELSNPAAHRAVSDAEACGHIFIRLLDMIEKDDYRIQKPIAQELEEYASTIMQDRIPLSDIKCCEVLYSTDWEQGEKARKAGWLIEAIKLFDKARADGYCSPALYESYAMAYRRLKDYENEATILDEAILRLPEKSSQWKERREKVNKLLLVQQKSKDKIVKQNKKTTEKERKAVEGDEG